MDTRIKRFKVIEDFPFNPFNDGCFTVTPYQLSVIEKFPKYFDDCTVEYEVIESNHSNGCILAVKRLMDGVIFKVGDCICYTLSHIEGKVLYFVITGFDSAAASNGNLYVCFYKKEREEYSHTFGNRKFEADPKALGVGINKISHLTTMEDGVDYLLVE